MFFFLSYLGTSTLRYSGLITSQISCSESVEVHDAVFVSVGSCISISADVSVLLENSFFFNNADNALYFSLSSSDLNISGISFYYLDILNKVAFNTQTTGKSFLNCSTFAVKKMNPVLKFTNGDYTSQMINITQSADQSDNSWQSTTSGTYMDFRNLNSVSFSLFGMYKCNGGNNYVNYFSSCKSIEFKNMNTYWVACWNNDATHYSFYFLSCQSVSFEDCYFRDCTPYDNGVFLKSESSSCTFTNCYYNVTQGSFIDGSPDGLTQGIDSTPTIPFLATWFCDAEVAYRSKTIPVRTLPTPCPPVPEAKQPRKMKRIITTAASAAPAVLCDSI